MLNNSVENKTKYEVAVKLDERYVVLAKDEDRALVVKYSVNNEGRYIFCTDEYSFLKLEDCVFSYVNIGGKPIIP